ncbi:MAG: hypothetical protein HY466_07040 [Deltaproteobacteria bacterium]|nr:hypothetical protein [Deltaproteobacteria bacterium]
MQLISKTDIGQLKHRKAEVDTLFNNNRNKIIVFVKLADKNDLVQIENEKWPDSIETTYNLFKGNNGKLIVAREMPYSESGDWDITFSHYFDKDGKTFAFERQTIFFNSICTDDVAYETKTEYYDTDLKIIGKEYKLIDQKGNSLQKDSCIFDYDRGYKVIANIDKYLRDKKIKNGK